MKHSTGLLLDAVPMCSRMVDTERHQRRGDDQHGHHMGAAGAETTDPSNCALLQHCPHFRNCQLSEHQIPTPLSCSGSADAVRNTAPTSRPYRYRQQPHDAARSRRPSGAGELDVWSRPVPVRGEHSSGSSLSERGSCSSQGPCPKSRCGHRLNTADHWRPAM